jgi:hypothetical protein
MAAVSSGRVVEWSCIEYIADLKTKYSHYYYPRF